MSLAAVESRVRALADQKPECVVCHCSLGSLGVGFGAVPKLLDCLSQTLGPNVTLLLPSFPFATNAEYAAYLATPIQYDACLTPARVNLIGELFRRRRNVGRSLNPIFPLAAAGPLAEELLADDHREQLPFAPQTAFAKLLERRTYVLGLGVNVNTCSFVHLVDDPFADAFASPLYSSETVEAELGRDGQVVGRSSYRYLRPEIRRGIRPIALHPLLVDQAWYSCDESPFASYFLDVPSFVEFGRNHFERCLSRGVMPAWHPQAERAAA